MARSRSPTSASPGPPATSRSPRPGCSPPPPIGPPSPARGFEGTRLDAHPFAEPLPSGPLPGSVPPGPPPARTGRDVRSIVYTVLAIVAAALVGILVASLLSNGRNHAQA